MHAMTSEYLPGFAFVKKEFIKENHLHIEQVAALSISVKKKRKHEKLAVKFLGPSKLCPYVIVPFPEPNENSSGDALNTTTHGICPYIADGCRYSHDLEKALAEKLPNLPGPCPVLVATGHCTVGKLCRWASGHILSEIPPLLIQPKSGYLNCLSQENRTKLQKKQYCFGRADSITRALLSRSSTNFATQEEGIPSDINDRAPLGHVTDEDEIRCRTSERKQIEFANKLYLAPLTTVGNLPFRRVCKRLGAEITCGEMAIATQLLQGKQSEWALLRRHSSEDMFGVQLCGAHVDTMTRAAQLIEENCEVDFVDINCGCPIDIIWKKGAGAGLLQHGNRLESIVRGVNGVLERAQVTVKLRTGIREKKNTAHQLIPSLQSAGAALITVRARYMDEVENNGIHVWLIGTTYEIVQKLLILDLYLVFHRNGDVLSYEDYIRHKEASGVTGIMIARGALIKPWIFTEIRESRHWDISAGERLDILREFTNYGLELWGADSRGVETTRRFLLEWLSFLYRYIPYGILERVPQQINERPPAYFCRTDLETLMASENCADWIRIRSVES
ncbi:hypothetical protein P879_03374 [Paragonimus westermani]|uniref:tRNA-dihydrouridine(47) synthase [NAD(P)(+)] n=1 Tax=Paragonimus westermani TaxID=34504 RepID=A0A8T0D5Q4_9TREM|nr:hypothetical protein P879_03374 [Paragonimus westermani]